MGMCRSVGSLIAVLAGVLALAGNGSAQTFLATGGSGDAGGQGGEVEFRAHRGVSAGGRTKVKAPRDPRVKAKKATLIATDLNANGLDVADLDASAGDLDPDLFEVTTQRDFVVPPGVTLQLNGDVDIVSTQGSIFIAGNVQDNSAGPDGVDLSLSSLHRQVVVLGNIDVDGDDDLTGSNDGGDGGNVDLNGLQVLVGGTATISARGGDGATPRDGGRGGDVTVESFRPVIQARKVLAAFGPNTTVDLSGGDGDAGGDGGSFEVNYRELLGNRSLLTLTGSVDVRGGDATAGGNSGGDGGDIDGDVGRDIRLAGSFDVRGGNGPAGTDAGDAGRIRFGGRAPGAGRIFILGDTATPGSPVTVNVSGGAATADDGDAGGSFNCECDQGKITWHGNIFATGGASVDGDGADGGEINFLTSGNRRADIQIVGDLSAFGSDAATDGVGSAGGDVEVVSLDGSLSVVGDIDTRGGDAVGFNNDADGAGGGNVYLLVDDTNGLPGTGPLAIDLMDNIGRNVFFDGNITTDGGNAGAGDADGSDAGHVSIDADSDDGEDRKNGTGRLADNSVISALGGNGSGTGANGTGGDVTLRASNRQGDNTTPSGFDRDPLLTTINATGGTGGLGSGGGASQAGNVVED